MRMFGEAYSVTSERTLGTSSHYRLLIAEGLTLFVLMATSRACMAVGNQQMERKIGRRQLRQVCVHFCTLPGAGRVSAGRI